MECPLCGAHIPEGNLRCQLCDTLVTPQKPKGHDEYVLIGTVDVTKPRLCRRKLTIAAVALSLLFIPWLLMADLFVVPHDVKVSRRSFDKIVNSYNEDKSQWHEHKEQVLLSMQPKKLEEQISREKLSFDEVPLETVVAFFEDNLAFTEKYFNHVKFFPSKDLRSTTFLISKNQKGVWRLNIMLSLEVRLSFDDGKLQVLFQRLRRGKRDVSPKLAWIYFGPELEAFRKLEGALGGIINPRVYSVVTEETASASPLRLGSQYSSQAPF